MRYKNKDQQQLQQTHPTDITEVEKAILIFTMR